MTVHFKFFFLNLDCDCNELGSEFETCDGNGVCTCKTSDFVGDKCSECRPGLHNFPLCSRVGPISQK